MLDVIIVNAELTKGLRPAFESIILPPVKLRGAIVMPNTQITSAAESRAQTLREMREIADRVEKRCGDFLARSAERERHYGVVLSAHRPAGGKASLDDLLKRAHAELGY